MDYLLPSFRETDSLLSFFPSNIFLWEYWTRWHCLSMCGPNILSLSLTRVLNFIIFLVLTCDARTIEECSDFLQVKVWRYRRQLLTHHSNIWMREVAAWESESSFAYVLREATDGDTSYGAIYDESLTMRSCKIMDGYNEEGNTRLISDMREEYDRSGTEFDSEEYSIIGSMLRVDSHSSTTFEEIAEMLIDENVPHKRRSLGKHKHKDRAVGNEDHIRISNKPSKGSDGPSVEIYRNLPTDIADVLGPYVDFKSALEQCNEINANLYSNLAESSESRWLPSPIRFGLETIGILDPIEEDDVMEDDVIDDDFVEDTDDFLAEESGVGQENRQNRQKRGLFMFPGTLWCGTGNRAPTHESLGMYNKTDMCCRGHDTSPSEAQFIVSGETKHHLRNWGMFTLTHCSLDKRFHKCLRRVRTTAAYEVGRGYFNVFNVQCFVIRNRKQCLETYWYMPWKCKKHEYEPTACLRSAQLFPSRIYMWPS